MVFSGGMTFLLVRWTRISNIFQEKDEHLTFRHVMGNANEIPVYYEMPSDKSI